MNALWWKVCINAGDLRLLHCGQPLGVVLRVVVEVLQQLLLVQLVVGQPASFVVDASESLTLEK